MDHIAQLGVTINSYKVLFEKSEGRRPLERSRRRWEINTKMNVIETRFCDVV